MTLKSWTLEELPRLMAQVFALRLLVLGMVFLLVSVLLIPLNITQEREFESLCILFSLFIVIVALVLFFVRCDSNINRLLMACPISLAVAPTLEYQFLAICLSMFALLEALTREASPFSIKGFRLCQALLLGALFGYGFAPLPHSLLLGAGLSLLTWLAFVHACRAWLLGIRKALDSLDEDSSCH